MNSLAAASGRSVIVCGSGERYRETYRSCVSLFSWH